MSTKNARSRKPDERRREYTLARLEHPVRGKHLARTAAGSKLVLLDADLARAFPTAKAVNDALRLLVTVARTKVPQGKKTRRPA